MEAPIVRGLQLLKNLKIPTTPLKNPITGKVPELNSRAGSLSAKYTADGGWMQRQNSVLKGGMAGLFQSLHIRLLLGIHRFRFSGKDCDGIEKKHGRKQGQARRHDIRKRVTGHFQDRRGRALAEIPGGLNKT